MSKQFREKIGGRFAAWDEEQDSSVHIGALCYGDGETLQPHSPSLDELAPPSIAARWAHCVMATTALCGAAACLGSLAYVIFRQF